MARVMVELVERGGALRHGGAGRLSGSGGLAPALDGGNLAGISA